MLISIKNFIKNYIVYTEWKDNDKYPSLIYNNLYFQRASEFLGFSDFRVKFWNYFARKYPPFSGFYSYKGNNTKPEFDDLYSKGFILRENFLPQNIHEKYSKIFQSEVTKFLESEEFNNDEKKQVRINVNLKDHDLKPFEDEVTKRLLSTIEYFYKKPVRPIFRYELEVSKDGTDYVSALAKWHIDRFMPSLKCLYFPLGVNIAPFSFIEGSHIIDEEYYQNAKFFRSINNYQKNSKKGVMLRDDLKFQLNEKLKNKVRELNNLDPNTMYLGAHQGLHRKKPFDSKGYRFHISIEFTHSFSKFDLIKNALFS